MKPDTTPDDWESAARADWEKSQRRTKMTLLGIPLLAGLGVLLIALALLLPTSSADVTVGPGAPFSAGGTPTPTEPPAERCTTATEPFQPIRITFDSATVPHDSLLVRRVGKDADGNPAAPPLNEPFTLTWYERSPAPGSTQGNVILTAHTFAKGGALGNDLYGEDTGLKEGDLLTLHGAEGERACYRYARQAKIEVDTYDPESGVFHNLDGPPQIALMVCWDHVPTTNEWDSRIIFYAELVE